MDSRSGSEHSSLCQLISKESTAIAKSPPGQKKQKVLDEDAYVEEMEKIITRDFFPDLNKLKAQNEYLDALQNNDVGKLHEMQLTYKPRTLLSQRYSSQRSTLTPSAFDTPEVFQRSLREERDVSEQLDNLKYDATQDIEEHSNNSVGRKSLDKFLSQVTSEDNASFEEIMEKDAVQHQQKYPWLYKDESEMEEKLKSTLALPSSNSAAIEDKPNSVPITWTYKNRNSLMYVPNGAEYTIEEKLRFEKRQTVEYDNTRFASPPFDEQANKVAIAEAASVQAKMKEGKVGIDGKEIINDDSPQVNGYGFIGSPSPAPGVTETPIMTWGEIEGTPFRLDGSDTPIAQSPCSRQFKIPEIPARERIALSLADKAAKKKRQKKEGALKHVQSSWLTPSPKFGSASPLTPSEKLQTMSPAVQKLASTKLGIHRNTDKALRASYTPSPIHTPQSIRTPDVTPQMPKTPVNSTPKTKVSVSSEALDHMKRRLRAQDFF